MKMVKSLLLVSAAGLVAVSGAQAADLPVKAKPVEYVKVCSLYGVGFYYVPGTDICLKVGAYFRAEYAYGNIGSSLTNLESIGPDGQRSRVTGPEYNQRGRAFIFLDSRQQTAYGTLRAYMNIGWTSDIPTTGFNAAGGQVSAAGVYANRAFIQLAGFTWGLATSYYDFYSSPATSYSVPWSSDTGDGGWKVAAYTAQFGNGVSGSLSLEEPRRSGIINTSLGFNAVGSVNPGTGATRVQSNDPFLVGSLPLADENKVRWPDIVANLRVDQAWGSAQIMGAVHDASGGYYTGTSLTGSQNNGHPSNEIGWAAGAGIKVNFPMIGPGDYFQAQVNYAVGATRYVAFTPAGTSSPGIFGGSLNTSDNSLGVGWFSDGVFCGGAIGGVANGLGCGANGGQNSSIQLTTAWGVNAAYEHFWTPSLRTSLVGGYFEQKYNGLASALMCDSVNNPVLGGGAIANSLTGISNCGAGSFDFQWYTISSRTQWNITKDFYVGLEGFYGHLNTASKGQTALFTQAGSQAQPTGVRTLDDQNVLVGRLRVHRDLVP